jgi:hypothetical protein
MPLLGFSGCKIDDDDVWLEDETGWTIDDR